MENPEGSKWNVPSGRRCRSPCAVWSETLPGRWEKQRVDRDSVSHFHPLRSATRSPRETPEYDWSYNYTQIHTHVTLHIINTNQVDIKCEFCVMIFLVLTCVAWPPQTAPGSCQSAVHYNVPARPSASSEASPGPSPVRSAARPYRERSENRSRAGW